MHTDSPLRKTLIALAIASIATLPLPALADHHESSQMDDSNAMSAADKVQSSFENGWREGKIETALLFNTHLNNFKIDSEVLGDTAILYGQVSSAIERDLAEAIAFSVDGINKVDNQLTVAEEPESRDGEDASDKFLSAIDDATITAKVKMKLLVNENLSGLKIDVDTENRVVTLSGTVASAEEKILANALAENTEGVSSVDDQLEIVSDS